MSGNWKGAASCLPKLLWLSRYKRVQFEQSDTILFGAHSYISWKLLLPARSAECDYTTASTTGLMEKGSAAWCSRFLHAENADAEMATLSLLVKGKFPKLINSADAESGHINLQFLFAMDKFKKKISATCLEKLQPGRTKVYHGAGDLATTSVGAKFASQLMNCTRNEYIYVGTSGWIAQITSPKYTGDRAESKPKAGVFNLLAPDPSKSVRAAPLTTAGGCINLLENLFSSFLSKEYPELCFHDALYLHSKESPVGSNKLIFLPHLNGERSPVNDPNVKGGFIGLKSSHNASDMIRATLEGICFQYRWLAETLGVKTNTKDCMDAVDSSPLLITGGGASSDVWRQIFADVLNVPIAFIDIGVDMTTLGTVALILENSARTLAQNHENPVTEDEFYRQISYPADDDRVRAGYDELYRVWRDMFQVLREPFARLSQIVI